MEGMEIQDSACSENFDHLSSRLVARPRFKSGLDTSKLAMASGDVGAIIEIDEDEDNLPFFHDEEEVFDSDILSYLPFTGPRDLPTVKIMANDVILEEKTSVNYLSILNHNFGKFEVIEKGMTPLVEDGSVLKQVLKPGDGKGKIPDRCKIFYHYFAVAEGSNQPFDASMTRKYPYMTDLRKCMLVPGMELAVRSMEIGEVACFILHPSQAFLGTGVMPRIPANTKVLIVIEMLYMLDEHVLNTIPYMTSDERAELPFSDIVEEALTLRRAGNGLFEFKDFQQAVRKWRRAINILEDYSNVTEEDEKKRCEILFSLYVNLASAYLEMERAPQACQACKLGLRMVEGIDRVKLLHRFAKAKFMLNDVDAALGLINEGLSLDPRNSNLLEFKRQVQIESREQDKRHREMCRRMMKLSVGAEPSKKAPNKALDQMKHQDNVQFSRKSKKMFFDTPEKHVGFEDKRLRYTPRSHTPPVTNTSSRHQPYSQSTNLPRPRQYYHHRYGRKTEMFPAIHENKPVEPFGCPWEDYSEIFDENLTGIKKKADKKLELLERLPPVFLPDDLVREDLLVVKDVKTEEMGEETKGTEAKLIGSLDNLTLD